MMMSLLYKDLMNLKQQARIYLLVLAIWVVVAGMENDPSFLGGMLTVFSVLIAVTAYAYDEKNGWDKYALTMPVGRREMVLSKYALSLLALVCSMALFAGMNAALRTPVEEFSDLLSIFLTLGLLALDVVLPLIFRFGVEKGRVVLMLAFLIPGAIGLTGGEFIPDPVTRVLFSEAFMYAWVAAAVLLLPVSISVSLAIYRRKEF